MVNDALSFGIRNDSRAPFVSGTSFISGIRLSCTDFSDSPIGTSTLCTACSACLLYPCTGASSNVSSPCTCLPYSCIADSDSCPSSLSRAVMIARIISVKSQTIPKIAVPVVPSKNKYLIISASAAPPANAYSKKRFENIASMSAHATFCSSVTASSANSFSSLLFGFCMDVFSPCFRHLPSVSVPAFNNARKSVISLHSSVNTR